MNKQLTKALVNRLSGLSADLRKNAAALAADFEAAWDNALRSPEVLCYADLINAAAADFVSVKKPFGVTSNWGRIYEAGIKYPQQFVTATLWQEHRPQNGASTTTREQAFIIRKLQQKREAQK